MKNLVDLWDVSKLKLYASPGPQSDSSELDLGQDGEFCHCTNGRRGKLRRCH